VICWSVVGQHLMPYLDLPIPTKIESLCGHNSTQFVQYLVRYIDSSFQRFPIIHSMICVDLPSKGPLSVVVHRVCGMCRLVAIVCGHGFCIDKNM
jgi:hypothetical protein